MRLTLLRAKEAFAKKCQADELEYRLNRACERLILHGKFNGSVRRIALAALYGQVTLPPFLRTIEGVKVGGRTFELANHWYDFLPGKVDCNSFSMDVVTDLGDGHATLYGVPAAGTIAVTFVGSPQPVTFYGEDFDNLPIELTIVDTTPVANPFAIITRIHKEIGTAALSVNHTAADTTVTKLAIMAPREEETFYRRYKIDNLTNTATATVEALAKIRHVEFTADTDVLPFSNVSAIGLALDALQMEGENDTNLAASYFNDAVELLNAELKDTNGDTALPVIRFLYPGRTNPNFRSTY